MTRTRATFGCCGAPATPDRHSGHKCNLGRGGGKSADTAEASKERSATGRVQGRVDAPRAAHPAPSKPHGRAAEDAMAEQLASIATVRTFGEWLRCVEGSGADDLRWDVVCWVREYPWGLTLPEPRRFRADFAHPLARLLLEIEGGAHGVQRQRKHDVLRDQLAQQAGYRILRVLPEQIATGDALALVRAAVRGGAK